MLYIDDAGWGSLVGGVVLGVYSADRHAFASGVLPPALFQNDDPLDPNRFRRQVYLAEAVNVVRTCLAALYDTDVPAAATVALREPVTLGRGFVLEAVRTWLAAAGCHYQTGRASAPTALAAAGGVGPPLQGLVAQALQAHLADLGFNVGLDLLTDHTKAGLLWWRQIQWLKAGNVEACAVEPARAAHCKTGWSNYALWANHGFAEARRLNQQARRRGR